MWKQKQKGFNSLDVYKLSAFLHRLALCPFIGFPHLRHLSCFLCFVVGASNEVWVLDCKTSCWWPGKQKQKKKCQGRTIGNYYKLIQRIVILEGLEWSERNYSFYSTKCEFILEGEVASPASNYKDVNILHSTCGIQSCQLSFLSLSEILHSIWFIDSKLRCQRSWDLCIVLFWHLFQLWFGLDTEEVSLHLLNIIWWEDANLLFLWNSKNREH